MPSKYSIKDLERLSGIKAHTLRMWEQRYEILNPDRTETNIRYYSNEDLKRILNISLLNNNGYKISSIAKLSNDKILEEANRFLDCYLKESNQSEKLMLCLMEMDEGRFEHTINNSIIHFGFEHTIEKVIFPFLKQVGNMWQLGIINPAQEHHISNLVRQKIIARIDMIKPVIGKSAKAFIFFLPYLELHELGLLYAYYLTKSRGHKCLYLGQNVPFEDLAGISKSFNPDYVVSIYTARVPGLEIEEFLNSCNDRIDGCQFFISGRLLFSDLQSIKIPSERFVIFENFRNYEDLISADKI